MRETIFKALNKIYGIIMTVSFFAGILPLFLFVVAMIIGGDIGEKISLFLYKDVYPYIIASASVAIWVGWIAMYVGKKKGLSVKNISGDDKK